MSVTLKKRLSHKQLAAMHQNPNMKLEENQGCSGNLQFSKKKRKFAEEHCNSKASVAISMRDERILQMDCDSVTDSGNYVSHCDASSNDSKNNHHQIKKSMIGYLSRVADRNKPMFVFNQKLNLGGDSSDEDTGTPSFSLVALIHDH